MNPRCLLLLVLSVVAAIATMFVLLGQAVKAHELDCKGASVSEDVKSKCCSKSDDHVIPPGEITRGANGEYVITHGIYAFVIEEAKALPSDDGCNHLFYQERTGYEGGAQEAGQPSVYCFFTFMGL